MNGGSHQEIWNELRKGNRDALLGLYKAHYVGLMNYGIRMTTNRVLTKDCITQVLMHLWKIRNRLPEVDNVRSYLLTCLRNELLAELQSENTRLERNRLLGNVQESAERSYEECLIAAQSDQELKQNISRAIAKLTAREQELLRMRFFEDRPYDEIAMECGITKRTAYNIIHAALKMLKDELMHYKNDKLIYLPLLQLLASQLS
jgi:RNA polymerase sigma-70 factor (ECF subfamily)